MTSSPKVRLILFGTMLLSIAVVLVSSAYLGWREWPRWRALQELRAAVEAADPAC